MTILQSTSKSRPSEPGILVRQIRQLLGLTQEQFAAQLGVTLGTINRWENNRVNPSPLALQRIKTRLEGMKSSEVELHQVGAQQLLNQYF
jgi:putative transcriptional regulator